MSKRGGKSYWSNWRTVRANVARHLEDFSVQQVPSITESSNSVETSQCTSNSLVENEKPCDQVFDNNSIVQELNNEISSQSDYDSEDRSINHSPNRIFDCLIDSSSAEGSSDDGKNYTLTEKLQNWTVTNQVPHYQTFSPSLDNFIQIYQRIPEHFYKKS